MKITTPLSSLAGIGPSIGRRLTKLNLYTIEDLIYHFPFRYDDFSKVSKISEAKVGEIVTLQGDVWSIQNTYTRFRKVLTKAILNDGSGSVEIIWFNQSWLTKSIAAGDKLQVSGKIDKTKYKTTLLSPDWEKLNGEETNTLHTGRLVPIYPETAGLTSKWMRQKIAKILPAFIPEIKDPLPEKLIDGMVPLPQALQQIHFPQEYKQIQQAKRRLAYDELFFIQLATLKVRKDWQMKKVTQPLVIDHNKLSDLISNLPFELTGAQKRVIDEISEDLKQNHPMNRLVQGEVGSGKTVVAAAIAYLVYLNGLRSALMAPTEILAFQHHKTLTNLLSPYGIKVGIYTGSRKFTQEKEKQEDPDIIVGTHALLSEQLIMDQVGLVIVDEQQRFGVEQRSSLRNRTKAPHFLTMTATPIPRTVALTLYGDLDLSVIDELPKGRKEVRTHFVPSFKRNDSYKFIEDQVKSGHQVYIITPLIEESETQFSAKAATVEYERLQKEVFPKLRLGLLHGRLKSKEKEQVINDFKDHKIDILVSTSVVEVGVDVPNATIMVVEGAERFGLAQLHQFRGRVGRGEAQSYTFLFAENEESGVIRRLKHLETIHEGLKLAELDLKIRGSGEIFGTRQSGDWDLKMASLSDLELIEKTREAAKMILTDSEDLDKYPLLKAKLSAPGREIFPD